MEYRTLDRLRLYRTIYMIRKAERTIQKYYHEDEMKTPMHMSMGGEAIVAGVCHALDDQDQVFGTYRSHALYLAKTNDVKGFFGEMYGKVTGNARGKAGSMHLSFPEKGHMISSAIVGTTIPCAVGAAFAQKFTGSSRVAVAFFGDGATDEGTFWESLNLSCSMKVPVLFVCEDNGYAVHTPTSARRGYNQFEDVVSGFNCTFKSSSSTNPVDIYNLASGVIDDVRKNRPAILHLKYYRYLEHVGVNEDFDAGYRSKTEAREWIEQDPVVAAREEAISEHGKSTVIDMEKEVDNLISEAILEAKSAVYPSSSEACQGVLL